MKKIITIVGARPQFIKASAISRVIREKYSGIMEEVLIHTGQHFDKNMSQVFFEELDVPPPKYNLAIAGGSHGSMTGRMLESIEKVLLQERPDWVLIYGDTNSTLAGALAAAKLHIPVAHVEAGLRSFNMRMPEEINRIVADRISSLLFCPSEVAVDNLRREGLLKGVSFAGDVMYDVALQFVEIAQKNSIIIKRLDLACKPYVLATCHRAENTDDPKRLASILKALNIIAQTKIVVLPIHPRTRQKMGQHGFNALLDNLSVIEPVSYLDMVMLEKNADLIVTDSGGIQKEAFFYKIPCITIRDETEWVETINAGWNEVTGANVEKIVTAFQKIDLRNPKACQPYGEGQAAEHILKQILVAS